MTIFKVGGGYECREISEPTYSAPAPDDLDGALSYFFKEDSINERKYRNAIRR